MLNGGHLDLNSVQFCSDSLKERLKKMMLNQELVFMGQVFDLHRLYRIQTAMAEDIKQRGLDDYNSHARGVNSSPLNLNNQVKYSMSDKHCTPPGFKPKPLDLQLSADEFIRQSATSTLTGSSIESKNKDTLVLDLNLSLNIDEETSKKGGEHRPWIGKRTWAPPPDIIDLEDPNSSFLNNDTDLGLPSGFFAPHSSFRDNHVFERSIISESQSFLKSGSSRVSDGTTSSRPFINVDRTYQRQTLCESGFKGDLKPSDSPVSRKSILLDLNTIQLDDLSDLSNTHSGVVNPLATPFSTVREKNNLKFGDKISRDSKYEDDRGKIIFIDLDSDSDFGEELCSSKSDPKIESVGSSSKLSNGLSCEIEMGEGVGAEADTEKDPKPLCQSLLVTEQPSNQKLSNSSQSESVVGVQTCSIKTMQSGVNGGDSNFSSSSDESQMIDMGLRFKNKELKVDETAQKAGELLVELSLQKLNSEVCRGKEHDQPQCSSESYEAMVLNAKECGPDDYCVSSNAFVVDVSEKKDSRYKLKRGTRMKDFQRDILSSLSTLSRQEIREDINIFEGVIRSREYKKMRAKMADGDDWCKPTRSKRSRISRR